MKLVGSKNKSKKFFKLLALSKVYLTTVLNGCSVSAYGVWLKISEPANYQTFMEEGEVETSRYFSSTVQLFLSKVEETL